MNSKESIALELKGYLEYLEFDFIDNDLLTEVKDYFKNKQKKNNFTGTSVTRELENSISHEAQVSFLIDHGIEIKQNIKELKSEYILMNFKRVEFYGVEYYLRIKAYEEGQEIYDYLIKNHIVEAAA